MPGDRESYQQGYIERVHRAKGPDQWVYRWWEAPAHGAARIHRSKIIGSVKRFPTAAKAKLAVDNFRAEINAPEEKTAAIMTVGEAWAHFQANELRDPDVDRSPTTIQSYLDYFKARILPKWKDVSLDDVKSVAIEKWLRSLVLAPASKAKIRNHMSALFSHCIRHELYNKLNPIASVRQSAVRQRDPDIGQYPDGHAQRHANERADAERREEALEAGPGIVPKQVLAAAFIFLEGQSMHGGCDSRRRRQ